MEIKAALLRRLRLASLLYDRHRTDRNHDELIAAARAVGRDYVRAHDQKHRYYTLWQRREHAQRKAAGLCVACGKKKARPARVTCMACGVKSAAGTARYKKSLEEDDG